MSTGETPPPPPPPSEPPVPPTSDSTEGGMPTSEERTMGLLCHLLGIVIGFLGPLLIWILKKDNSPFIDDQGKEALNFQLVVFAAMSLCLLSSFFLCFTFILILPLEIFNLVFCVMGAMKAYEGQWYRYPLTHRFIQ